MNYIDYGFSKDYSPHHAKWLLIPILKMLKGKHKSTILDLGCGQGFFAGELIKKGFNCFGVDASSKGIEIANELFPDKFYLHNFDKGTLLPVALEGQRFDIILSTEVIEHLYNPILYLKNIGEILRVSETEGYLILSTPYNGYLKNLVLSLFDKWDFHMNPLWVGGHIKFWSKKTLTKAIEEAGFIVEEFHGLGRFPYLWKSMLLKCRVKK